MSFLQSLIPHLQRGAIVLFAFAVIAFGLSVLYFRRARTAPYYIMREAARHKGVNWFLGAVAALMVGVGLLFLHDHPPQFPPPPTPAPPTATATPLPAVSIPTATLPPLPTATLPSLPTTVPSATPTRPPTATPPFIPTPTPTYPLPEGAVPILPNAVPAAPEAQITFAAFALDVENRRPVEPGLEFPPGDHRIYFFFNYQDMTAGSTWTYAWYRNGEYLDGNTCLWASAAGDCPQTVGVTGTTYLFYRPPGGYEPGTYEVRVWIEDRVQSTAQFVITE